jgi:hypothetical protein
MVTPRFSDKTAQFDEWKPLVPGTDTYIQTCVTVGGEGGGGGRGAGSAATTRCGWCVGCGGVERPRWIGGCVFSGGGGCVGGGEVSRGTVDGRVTDRDTFSRHAKYP